MCHTILVQYGRHIQYKWIASGYSESGSKQKTRLPRSNGHWSGEEGNSLWYSDIEAVK